MDSNKKYWKGLEELQQTPAFVKESKGEFAEPLPIENVLSEEGLSTKTPRRDFLKALGFGLGAVSLAACQSTPVHKSIPYLIKPEEVTPGIPNYYASTYKGQSILVKTREGRPILVEPNPSSIGANRGTDAGTQASVLDLYDLSKLQQPTINGKDTGWNKLDSTVIDALTKASNSGKEITLVSSSIYSPSALSVIAEFAAKYPTVKHVQVDTASYAGMIKANQANFNKAGIPNYRFDKANVIVSVGADFLGTWLSAEEYTQQYATKRDYKSLENKVMSRHIHFETGLSLTGSNADARVAIKPSEEAAVLISLYNAITGGSIAGGIKNHPKAEKVVALAAKELLGAKGEALVVAGSNHVALQSIANAINASLESYGNTIDLDNLTYQYKGNDTDFAQFLNDAKAGRVGVALLWDVNPVYDYFNPDLVKEALENIPTVISFADRADETASLATVVAPNHNYLESWGDSSVREGYYTVIQPTINPIFNTRQAEQSLLIWADSEVDYYDFVKSYWEDNILDGKSWEDMLQTGFEHKGLKPASSYSYGGSIEEAASAALSYASSLAKDVEVQLYLTTNMRDGKQGNNALLLELPEPVSKVTWDNFVAINPRFADSLGLGENSVATINGGNGYSIDLPVLLQPGQAFGTVSIALGYGRSKAGKAGNDVGKNAYPFASFVNGTVQFATNATVENAGGSYELALTQTHHTIEGRNVIREATFAEYLEDPAHNSGNHGAKHKMYDLWNKYEAPGHKWVVAIDLNACTGCGSCIMACNVENNIPVVGRDEVRRRREMHWLRIDRYYSFDVDGESVTEEDEIEELEKAEADLDNVSVVFQPMMCQHCDHAPCESVCPVLATVHSNEGLNHMAYNRCFGTRYCANNCPYKVRRFNWFNYWNDSRFDNYLNNEFTQLVLNPDVTSRSRGVMEKCSMCIQRIQAGKLKAKMEKRTLKDGDVQIACAAACSANAIIFGDLNDPNSEVAKALKNERVYYVLEEINVQPNVGYMTKVRNTFEA